MTSGNKKTKKKANQKANKTRLLITSPFRTKRHNACVVALCVGARASLPVRAPFTICFFCLCVTRVEHRARRSAYQRCSFDRHSTTLKQTTSRPTALCVCVCARRAMCRATSHVPHSHQHGCGALLVVVVCTPAFALHTAGVRQSFFLLLFFFFFFLCSCCSAQTATDFFVFLLAQE